jgi:hypothetical protein
MATFTVAVRPAHNQPQSFPPIQFTPHQVAVMAQIANELSPDFCRAATPHLSQDFLGFFLRTLVSDETPSIPLALLRALNVHQNRKGQFIWIPR